MASGMLNTFFKGQKLGRFANWLFGWEPLVLVLVAILDFFVLSLSSREGNIFSLLGFALSLFLVCWVVSIIMYIFGYASLDDLGKQDRRPVQLSARTRTLYSLGAAASIVIVIYGVVLGVQKGSCGANVQFKQPGDFVSTRASDSVYLDRDDGSLLGNTSDFGDEVAAYAARFGSLNDDERSKIESYACDLG